MTLDEYKALIQEAAIPEKAPAALADLQAAITDDLTSMDALKASIVASEKKISDLQATATKLFLAQTAPRQAEKPEEKEGQDFIDDFFDNLGKGA